MALHAPQSSITTIEWNDPGPFNSQLDANHAFVNFAEVLMYVPNRRAEDTSVAIRRCSRRLASGCRTAV